MVKSRAPSGNPRARPRKGQQMDGRDRERMVRRRKGSRAAFKGGRADKIRAEKQRCGGGEGASHKISIRHRKGVLPTFFSFHSSSSLPCLFTVTFLTTVSLFTPNHDAVPSILHSRYLVTSFDRPLPRTVDLLGPSTNTSNQSPLISGW